jgi:hypothetical protein
MHTDHPRADALASQSPLTGDSVQKQVEWASDRLSISMRMTAARIRNGAGVSSLRPAHEYGVWLHRQRVCKILALQARILI